MRYEGDYGKNVVEAPTPDARPTFNGRRYETRQMTVDITRTPCSDGMSDRRYPDTVRVTTRRGTARGCGGLSNDRPGPGASLAGTSWTIAAIDGRPGGPARPIGRALGGEGGGRQGRFRGSP